MAVDLSDSTASGLFSLPAELRNTIYELAFRGTVDELAYTRRPAPGLLLACKQTYAEARNIYYAEATFTFEDFQDSTISESRTREHFANQLVKIPRDCCDHITKIVLGPPCSIRASIYECFEHDGYDDHLKRIAHDAQYSLFLFRSVLRSHGLHDLAAKAQGTVHIPIRNTRKMHDYVEISTKDPWKAYAAEASRLGRATYDPHIDIFFKYEHNDPSRCWEPWCGIRHWTRRQNRVQKCKCPAIREGMENEPLVGERRPGNE